MRYLATKDLNFSCLMLDADEVPQELLQQAKAMAVSVLSINGGVDKAITDIPHELDGGWPDVDPEDAFVIYAQIPSGYTANDTFGGTCAMAAGANKQTRDRGVALALVLAAEVEKPEEVADEILQQYQKELSKLVVEAKRSWHQLKMQTETRSATAASSKGSKGSSSTEVGRKPASKSVPSPSYKELLEENQLLRLHVEELNKKFDRVAAIAQETREF